MDGLDRLREIFSEEVLDNAILNSFTYQDFVDILEEELLHDS